MSAESLAGRAIQQTKPIASTPSRPRIIAYLRLSKVTQDADEDRAGLEAQRQQIARLVDATEEVVEIASARRRGRRERLAATLASMRKGDTLAVARLDRMARSVIDGASMIEAAQRDGWNLVVADLGLNLHTPSGRMISNVILSIAQWERETISERTKAALAVKKLRGERCGRKTTMTSETRARIVGMKADGMNLSQIARALNADGTPTGQGGSHWRHTSVGAVLRSVA
jgi:DNA invertase Pin-like site-specific DNA recombinase